MSLYIGNQRSALLNGGTEKVVNNYTDYINGNIPSTYICNVETIRSYAFYGRDDLKTIILPNITYIDWYAFYNCSNYDIIITNMNQVCELYAYPGYSPMSIFGEEGLTIYVPDILLQSYLEHEHWSTSGYGQYLKPISEYGA